MKKILCALFILCALSCCSGAMAADDNMAKKEKKDGDHVTVTGMMAVKAKDAKSDVVCRLTTGKNKTDKMYNLVATGDLAKQIETMRQNGDKVKVSGKLSGEDVLVDKIDRVVYMAK